MGVRGNSGIKGVDRRNNTPTTPLGAGLNSYQLYLEKASGHINNLPKGITFWVDANSEYITLSGSDVINWADRSGNVLDLVDPPATADRPVYVTNDSTFNNYPSVNFQSDDRMETDDDPLLDCPDGFTVYVVTKQMGLPSTFNMLISRTDTTGWSTGWGIMYYSSNWRFWVNDWNNSSTRVDMGSSPSTSDGQHIFKLHYDKVNITGQIFGTNGVAETTKAYTASVLDPSNEGISLAWGGSDAFDIGAKYAEVMFYNSPLSADDQASVENYLKNKYNIS